MEILQKKQKDIVCKLADFENVTMKIQNLVGLAAITCKDAPPETGCAKKKEELPELPRVIVPPLAPMSQGGQVSLCNHLG